MNVKSHRNVHRDRGMVLVSALLLLLVATIMAASMFRSFGTQEKIASNLREKERALHAAQMAQQYAEWWMLSGTAPQPVACSSGGTVDSSVGSTCSGRLSDPTSLTWAYGVTYNPPSMTTTGPSGTPQNGTYFKAPQFYIYYAGPGAGGDLYQIDSLGYGGTQNAVAVVESTFVIKTSGHCADPALIC
jgi:type IV pilus assembly protein PilX